ncbi:lipoprotein [Streptomyces sp. TS71-3]|nr:lipoprotein [Streptomyces sp. TS71-3]
MGLAAGFALACVTGAMLSGCSSADAVCGGGEHPVMAVGSTGRTCVSDSADPPKRYAGYPKGKAPQHVGDKWDTYWRTHTVDGSGKIIKAPGAR